MKHKKTVSIFIVMALGIFSYAQTLKVITYIIRLNVESDRENAWPLRKDYLTSQIQFYEPDIFGVQEAKPDQVSDIANALYQYRISKNNILKVQKYTVLSDSNNLKYPSDYLPVFVKLNYSI